MTTTQDTITVRITDSVLWDIEGRDLSEHYGVDPLAGPGDFTITRDKAVDLADDARYQADPVDAGYGHSVGLRRAYTLLADRIDQALSSTTDPT